MRCDLQIEKASHVHLKDAVAYCESVRDYVSRELFVEILDDTEEHIDYIETQLELVDTVGEQNYLQSQMGEAS
jgi:bacterioferritin